MQYITKPSRDVGPLPESLFRTEYAPETQFEVLHITPESLIPPVLDLGCGRHGRLVRWLHRHDVPAVGIDQDAPARPGLIAGNWFRFSLGEAAWGSILSHMAFSSYFLRSHLRDEAEAQKCGTLYMKVLSALKPGGCFYYAPGLPFMESLLPASRFEVIRHPIETISGNWADQDLSRLFGRPVLYAVHVVRKSETG